MAIRHEGMMKGTAVIAFANHRRLRRAQAWLECRTSAEEVLVIGPTLDAANELSRKVAIERGAAFGWHRLSLSQLAAAVAAPLLGRHRLVLLSRLGTVAIATRVLHRLKAQGKPNRYYAVADTPGFPRAISGVINEVRLARLLPDSVGGVAPDLVPVITAYEAELTEAGLTDWPGVLALATEAVNDPNRHRLIGLPTLLLDTTMTSEAEFAFVSAVAAAAPDILATILSGDLATLACARDRLGLQVEDLDDPSLGGDVAGAAVPASLARLQRHLFKEQAKAPVAKLDNEVEVFSSPGEGRECVEIARRVLGLAKDSVPFDRIAVLLRSPEEYRAHLVEAFARAGIPAHFARGAVRPDPAGRAFYALLKCAAEGLSARRFAEYLSLAQVPDAAPGGTPPEPLARGDSWIAPDPEVVPLFTGQDVGEHLKNSENELPQLGQRDDPVRHGQLRAPRNWERLLIEAAVIGGRDRWQRRIEGLANDLRRKILELEKEDEIRAARLARTLHELGALAAYALPLIDDLANLPAAAHWGEWLDCLSRLATRAIKEPERVLTILSELSPMAPVGPVGLSEVLITLESVLLETAASPASQRYGGVFIGPIEAARGLSFDSVFVPGVAEKMFPRKIIEEPILRDAARQQVGHELATNQKRLENERVALALAVGAAERRICFSYPRLQLDQGRPRVPSFYALEIMRSAEGRLPDFTELTRRAEQATTARLGWPAPTVVDDAIDYAEYDLAILNSLVDLVDESAGRARYLLSANQYLARALRSRPARWRRAWTTSDGMLSRSELVKPIMAKHRFGARSYSPTALQNYARCPYRFFLQAIHGLAPSEIPQMLDDLDPLQRGSLIHDIQFELYEQLRKEKLLPVRLESLDQAFQKLDSVLLDVVTRYKDDLAPAIERVWENGIAVIRLDLREWLRRESTNDTGFVPMHFELSFGLESQFKRRQADPRSVPHAIKLDCGIQLRGSIDLIEGHSSGWLCVTDHKTGKADFKPAQLIAGGKSLQCLLYALAAEKLFEEEAKVTAGRLYFCTAAGGFVDHIMHLDEQARRAAVEVAEAIDAAIAGPFLPAAPDKRECARCDYNVVCGPYEEQRVARKSQERLEALANLRTWP
jgi:ATP-dependent helicase/nuclease subunit B